MPEAISVQFLRDTRHGGAPEQPQSVAAALAAFVGAAKVSVDLAIYDFRLSNPMLVSTVVGALTAAAKRGVRVRIGYDAGVGTATVAAAQLEADPAPIGTAEWVAEHFSGTGVQTKAIHAAPQLMHSKYLVRDATAPTAAVWTGSTNFTDDAWTLQENNILRISGAKIAAGYAADFAQLWASGSIAGSGAGDTSGATAALGWDFSPGDGPAIDAALCARIAAATTHIRVASMVLTSHTILAALAAAIQRGVPVSGIADAGQMDPIVRQWQASAATHPATATALADWEAVRAHLAVKRSTPYSPTSIHDFMHLKVLVTDGVLSTGSYNFSANAERNAENQVHTTDAATVQRYCDFIDLIAAAYGTR